jgi:hypothetical protein
VLFAWIGALLAAQLIGLVALRRPGRELEGVGVMIALAAPLLYLAIASAV